MSDDGAKTVKLVLRKPYYENYIRFIFECPEGSIKVKRDEILGRYLFSRVSYSDSIPVTGDGLVIDLVMPAHECDSSRFRFMHFTEEDTIRINDFIHSSAYLDFRTMVQVGVHDLKMDRKTVISMFSDLIYGEDKFEMLKKDEYRKRKKMHKWLLDSAKAMNYL